MMHARSAGRLCPIFLAAALAASGHTAQAQDTEPAEPPPCSSAPYRAFDFWIGDWTVTADGKEAGRNRIERILGGCALLESWTGAGESRGHSLNFYDAAQQTWHQTWIDNSGGPLYLSGGLENGTMVLSGQRPPRPGIE